MLLKVTLRKESNWNISLDLMYSLICCDLSEGKSLIEEVIQYY